MKRITTKLKTLCQFLVLCSAMFICSCATPEHPDPLEKFNRVLFGIDQVIDTAIIEPVASVYDVLPYEVHKGVGNFFSNTFEPAVVINDFLQGDINNAFMDFGRFLVNSTFGIAGLFDVAKHMGLVKHYNDFGITLAKWGFKNSAYLYVPCIGPMTIRDTASLAVDYWLFNPISYIPCDKVRLSVVGAGKIHWRWQFLPTDKVRREAFDPYVFMRDAFLQKRRAIINEVVVGHHTPEDTYVHELDEPIIDEEDIEEAQHKDAKNKDAQHKNIKAHKGVKEKQPPAQEAKRHEKPEKVVALVKW